MLLDQGRRAEDGREYKTQNNVVTANEMTFQDAACAGAASDTGSLDPNFDIIDSGSNRFDGNIYRVPRRAETPRLAWGRDVTDWNGFRRKGQEQRGRLILSDK